MQDIINVFWLRRDLRLHDNVALSNALKSNRRLLVLFIFDENILDELPKDDARVSHIYETLFSINQVLIKYDSSILVQKGTPSEVYYKLISEYQIEEVYWNKDYEPYAIKRDNEVKLFLDSKGVKGKSYKDHVIFEENEILKDDGKPYTVFTPYSKKWKQRFTKELISPINCEISVDNLVQIDFKFPSLNHLGFVESKIKVPQINWNQIGSYEELRNLPSKDATSKLSVHLRFGTISTRYAVAKALEFGEQFLNELIWREFFIQIMWHYPEAATSNFKRKYDFIVWRNNIDEFKKWGEGKTGYPIVDAGMRELNATGLMHNRVRMITASFLCKHLLIDWKWGEAYFAEKLLDYDISLNNGNWQWVAGTGCDAAPYFRVFNPASQTERFDPNWEYIKKWVPEVNTPEYPLPMIEHSFARKRALDTYKVGLSVS